MNLFLELTENTVKGLPIAIAAIQSVIQEVSTGKAIGAGVAAGAAGAGTYALANHIAKNGLPRFNIPKVNSAGQNSSTAPTTSSETTSTINRGPSPFGSQHDGTQYSHAPSMNQTQPQTGSITQTQGNYSAPQYNQAQAHPELNVPGFGGKEMTAGLTKNLNDLPNYAHNNNGTSQTSTSAPSSSSDSYPYTRQSGGPIHPPKDSTTEPQSSTSASSSQQPAPASETSSLDTDSISRNVGEVNAQREYNTNNASWNNGLGQKAANNTEFTKQGGDFGSDLTAGIKQSTMSTTDTMNSVGLDPSKDYTQLYQPTGFGGAFVKPDSAKDLLDPNYYRASWNAAKNAAGFGDGSSAGPIVKTGGEDPRFADMVKVPETPQIPTNTQSGFFGGGDGTLSGSGSGYFDTSNLTANMKDIPTPTLLPKIPTSVPVAPDATAADAASSASDGSVFDLVKSAFGG